MAEIDNGKGDVLIVDDNPKNLDLLAGMLRERAYRVRIANNGPRALRAARSTVPDIVMLDINMPEMDGYEVCRQLKADPLTNETPVIFISALDEAMDKVRAFEVGGTDYVTKPFQFEEVLARIDHQLKISRLRREMERKNVELQRANEEAQEASRAKSRFLASITHELRTPLNAIIGYSEILIEQAEELDQDEFVPDLKKIHGAARHQLALINDILDLSKIEAGKMELSIERFDLGEVLSSTVAIVRSLVEKRGNKFLLLADPALGVMQGDVTRVRQVLFNLLSNASKFTERGVISLEVSRRTAEDGTDWVTFLIRDTGMGIAPDQVGRLFQTFSQANSTITKLYGGTGLGLALSRRFCAMMGGDISVDSELGKGSVFTVRLPATIEILVPS